MTDDRLDRLAAAYGILRRYVGIDGRTSVAPDHAVIALLRALGVQADDPVQALAHAPPEADSAMRAPPGATCFLPGFLDPGRCWGVTCQVYALRSPRNCGIGDFEDLARLGERLAPLGADFIGVNPLHLLFLAEPERASPFYPSSRQYLNPLLIAVDAVEGYRDDLDQQICARLRREPLVDYPAVAGQKLGALRAIFQRRARSDAFQAFRDQGGRSLHRHALFQALAIEMRRQGHGTGWLVWPEAYRDPDGAAVAAFAGAHRSEVEFQIWLQWIADQQLAAVKHRLHAAGMRIGLYLDLAVGTAPDGSATWNDRDLTVVGVQIGAPPDMFQAKGQDWGLAPMAPSAIVARRFEPVRESYDAILRHAGALRIDHAMSLHRLFWIPSGHTPAEGAYAIYPMPDLVRTLAASSQAARALIIGEDLGVVPERFRDEMAAARILGYRLLIFEKDEAGFRPPARWPVDAMACLGSHDTPTLAGWWSGADIDVRHALGLFDADVAAHGHREREQDRARLLDLLHAEGLGIARPEASTPELAGAVHRLLARTPCRLLGVQVEDLVGAVEQVNVPGTTDEHPNWRRKLPVEIDRLLDLPTAQAIVAAVADERPRQP
jgi:4-alpha-glucanotransferase